MEDATNTMVIPFNTFKTITKLFVQIHKGLQISDSSNTPFINAHIIFKAYLLFQKTGMNSEERKAWDHRTAAENIWLNFLIHFAQSYKYLRHSQIAAVKFGFKSDNIVIQQETTKALNELASAVSSDRETFEHPNSTNYHFSGHIRT